MFVTSREAVLDPTPWVSKTADNTARGKPLCKRREALALTLWLRKNASSPLTALLARSHSLTLIVPLNFVSSASTSGTWRGSCFIPLFHTGHESPESPRIDFLLIWGIREVSFNFFSNRDVLRVSPDSDTISLRIFGGIGSIRLESRKNSLRLAKYH